MLIIVGLVSLPLTSDPLLLAAHAAAAQTPTIHTVRAGESLLGIAARYDVSAAAIAEANGLQDRDLIQIGQRLLIPVERSTSVQTPVATPSGEQTVSSLQRLLACPQNTTVTPLDLPAVPIRMAITGGQIYLIAGGSLFAMPIPTDGSEESVLPQDLTPKDGRVGAYQIQELVYVAVEADSGDLLLLDKTNDIYRYTTAGEWQIEALASPVAGQYPDPQYLAVQALDGVVHTLDADLQRIWQLTASGPQVTRLVGGFDQAVDMVTTQSSAGSPLFYVLNRDGTVDLRRSGAAPSQVGGFEPSDDAWPSHILLDGESLYVADGERRTVTAVSIGEDNEARRFEYRLPDMGRLRSLAVYEESLYALAGSTLYVLPLNGSSSTFCPHVSRNDADLFYGRDLVEIRSTIQLPFAAVALPSRPRSYPGARRLYRNGIHRGLDLYGLDAPGVEIGSPVRAIADGIVVRIDDDFEEMTPAEYERAIARTAAEHRTPPDLMDRFHGRQVRIDHGNGLESWYSHLSSTPGNLAVGDSVSQGDVVGRVGVSGTSSGAYRSTAGAHLHFELWIDGTYVGQGLSLFETMRLWQMLFEQGQ